MVQGIVITVVGGLILAAVLGIAAKVWHFRPDKKLLQAIGAMRQWRLRFPIYKPEPVALSVRDEVQVSESLQVVKIDPQIDFYENGEILNRLRGGLQAELETVEIAWLATNTGSYPANLDLLQTGKIKRLLLMKPDEEGHLKTFARAVPERTPKSLADMIKENTRVAQASGIEVRWYDGPILSVLHGSPYSDGGWCRVEVFTPYWADRMGYLVRAEVYTGLHKALVAAFDRQWQQARLADEADLKEPEAVRQRLIARLGDLALKAGELNDSWPDEESAKWRMQALETVSEAVGESSRYFQEIRALTFGGEPPVSWGQGLKWVPFEPPEVIAFRDRRSQDYQAAKGILLALVDHLKREGSQS